jgi:hypothetical protein
MERPANDLPPATPSADLAISAILATDLDERTMTYLVLAVANGRAATPLRLPFRGGRIFDFVFLKYDFSNI